MDVGRVIKGLECCMSGQPEGLGCDRVPCPYNDIEDCEGALHYDALALLKAQEPHVMTIDDMRDLRYGDFAIIEQMPGIIIPAIVADNIELNNNLTVLQVVTPLSNGRLNADYEYYGKTWRCWTSRPSTEQRESVKWD